MPQGSTTLTRVCVTASSFGIAEAVSISCCADILIQKMTLTWKKKFCHCSKQGLVTVPRGQHPHWSANRLLCVKQKGAEGEGGVIPVKGVEITAEIVCSVGVGARVGVVFRAIAELFS